MIAWVLILNYLCRIFVGGGVPCCREQRRGPNGESLPRFMSSTICFEVGVTQTQTLISEKETTKDDTAVDGKGAANVLEAQVFDERLTRDAENPGKGPHSTTTRPTLPSQTSSSSGEGVNGPKLYPQPSRLLELGDDLPSDMDDQVPLALQTRLEKCYEEGFIECVREHVRTLARSTK